MEEKCAGHARISEKDLEFLQTKISMSVATVLQILLLAVLVSWPYLVCGALEENILVRFAYLDCSIDIEGYKEAEASKIDQDQVEAISAVFMEHSADVYYLANIRSHSMAESILAAVNAASFGRIYELYMEKHSGPNFSAFISHLFVEEIILCDPASSSNMVAVMRAPRSDARIIVTGVNLVPLSDESRGSVMQSLIICELLGIIGDLRARLEQRQNFVPVALYGNWDCLDPEWSKAFPDFEIMNPVSTPISILREYFGPSDGLVNVALNSGYSKPNLHLFDHVFLTEGGPSSQSKGSHPSAHVPYLIPGNKKERFTRYRKGFSVHLVPSTASSRGTMIHFVLSLSNIHKIEHQNVLSDPDAISLFNQKPKLSVKTRKSTPVPSRLVSAARPFVSNK